MLGPLSYEGTYEVGVADGSRTHLLGVTSRVLPATETATAGVTGFEPVSAWLTARNVAITLTHH